MAIKKHALHISLRADRVHDARYRVVEDEHKDSSTKDVSYMKHLLFQVKNRSRIDSIFNQIEDRPTVHENNDNEAKNTCHDLKGL